MDPLPPVRIQGSPPACRTGASAWLVAALLFIGFAGSVRGAEEELPVGGGGDRSAREKVVVRGLDWLVKKQSRRGSWAANEGRYPTAMTALAGTAMLMEGSTTVQGRYAEPIRQAVDYLVSRSRTNGLIGDPKGDDRYTYGHGFSMLFLSQVLGEEED